MKQMEPIDLTQALKATDGDIALLQEVLEAFFEEYPTLLRDLESALQTGDSAVVQRASHTIKGSLRLFGNVRSKELAERLERMGAAGTLGDAMESYETLKQILASLESQLQEAMKALVARYS